MLKKMNTTNRYDKYKDSGIEWIGKIPDSWNNVRLRFLCNIQTGNKDTVDKNEYGEYPFYVRSPIIERIDTYSFDGEAILTAGDGVGAGKVFHYVNGKFDYHQRVYNLHNFNKICAKFLFYYLKENFYKEIEQSNAKSTVDSIRLPMLLDFPIVFAKDLKEQEAIAGYLDRKCGAIDETIEKQKSVIEKLKEYKQSIITQAVTKGLDKSAPMKDSGIEWIGQIPQHWRVVNLKNVLTNIKDGTHGTFQRVLNGEYLLSAKNISEKGISISYNESLISIEDYKSIISNGFPTKGDILICCVGTIGRCCIYNFDKPLAFQRSVSFLRCNNMISNKFLLYVLKSNIVQIQLNQYANVSAQAGIYMGMLKVVKIPISLDKKDQEQIAEFLDKKCSEIDKTIEDKEKLIEKLVEYKKSLIYECVTGKRKVVA